MNVKELQEKLEKERVQLIDEIKAIDEKKGGADSSDKELVQKMEAGLSSYHDSIVEALKDHESDEMKELREKIEQLGREPVGEPKSVGEPGEPEGFRTKQGQIKSYYRYWTEHEAEKSDGNLFLDMFNAAKHNDYDAAKRIRDFEQHVRTDKRMKAWATQDLEDVDLIVPDIQAALPFLQAAAKTVQLCRELRTSSTSVEFPMYTSGLTVDHVPEMQPKPEDTPTFDLISARVFTIAGLTEVPNQLLEDYPAARGWIASELGRATGVQENLDVLQGNGVGEPTGILSHAGISARVAHDVNADGAVRGRDVIEAIFRALQDVRVDGLTEPTDIVLNPAVWTDVVLSFEANIGYLYGPPSGDVGDAGTGGISGVRGSSLLGVPVTQDAYVSRTYGSTTNQSPIIVGDFKDAVVLRRSPFRVDVDTSLGFKINTTWFRGEERMGFIVVRPASFKVVTNVVPQA